MTDDFIVAKLKFFSYMCSLVEPYLTKYQTKKPMVPFMYNDLKRLFSSLLKLIVKPDVLEKCKNSKAMMELELSDKNLLTSKQISLGFGVEELLKEMMKKDIVSEKAVSNFRLECRYVVTIILGKLKERSPLACDFVRYCGIFDPCYLDRDQKKTLIKYFKGLLGELLTCRIRSTDECDAAALEFSTFCENLSKYSKIAESFDNKNDRLDDFWFKKLNVDEYPHLAKILKLVFCLFHGQASVEREFNSNHAAEKVNIHPETIVSKKRIINYFKFNEIKPKDASVSKDMMKAVRNSHKEYLADLEKKSAQKVKNDLENRRLAITEDLKDVSKKMEVLEKAIQTMHDEADQCFKKAEKESNMALVIQGNGLKRQCEESKSELSKLEEVQKDMEEKRRKLS